MEFDVLVIGGGPGGYTSAIRASQLGLKTALVERAELGGVCLNWGCIPTKSLLHTADVLREIRSAEVLGLKVEEPSFDLDKIVKRSRAIADRLSGGIAHLMKKNKIEVITGEAKFFDKNTVLVGEKKVLANNIILATGASARSLPQFAVDSKKVWSARNAMTPPFLPNRLLIVGAGAIGLEFASFYRELSVEVTIVEMLGKVAPSEDSEVAAFIEKAFTHQGIEVLTNTVIEECSINEDSIIVDLGNGKREFDAVIQSVGVQGNIDGLGLENLGVSTEKSFIVTDESCSTSIPGIYAIGDVAGAPCLAHKASHEGVIAAESIAGMATHAMKKDRIPACTYSHPQIASVGLSEMAAKESGIDVKVGNFPLLANGKAIAINDSEGFVKTIFDSKTGELVGAHMVGPHVTEMIQGFVMAIGLETTEAELINTIFPHPTISEAMHESVLSAFGRTINF